MKSNILNKNNPFISIKQIAFSGIFLGFLLFISCSGTKNTKSGDQPVENQGSDKALNHFQKGGLLELQGRIPEAILEYQDAVRYDPGASYIHFVLGKAYLKINKLDNGIESLENALDIAPGLKEAQKVLISAYMNNKEPGKAAELIEKGLKNSEDIPEHERLAYLYLRLGKPMKAVKVYEKLIRQNPDNRKLERQLLNLYGRTNSWIVADSFYQSLANEYPDSIRFWIARAEIKVVLKKKDEALSMSKDIVKKFPKAWRSHQFLGNLYAQFNENDKAIKELEIAVRLNPGQADTWINLGQLKGRKKEYKEALQIFLEAADKFPENGTFYQLAAQAYREQGDLNNALATISKALIISKDDLQMLSLKALIFEDLAWFDSTVVTYRKMLELDPDNATTLNNFAYTLSVEGKELESALDMITRALIKEPENRYYLDTAGWVHFKLGNLDEALHYLLMSLRVDSNPQAISFEHLGDVYMKMGKLQEAKDNYNKALSLEKDKKKHQKILKKLKSL